MPKVRVRPGHVHRVTNPARVYAVGDVFEASAETAQSFRDILEVVADTPVTPPSVNADAEVAKADKLY